MKHSLVGKLTLMCMLLCFYPFVLLLLIVSLGFPLVYLLLFLLPAIVLVAWIIYYVRKRIIKPILSLTAEAQLIAEGDLTHSISYHRNDELGQFITAFEEMRKTLHRQQKQQQQFELQRKNFINSISHDLKTPIASISGYIEALQDNLAATPAEEQQYLKIIENKLAALTELSNQLSLSYTTPETMVLALRPVNCRQWTTSLLESIAADCKIRGVTPTVINEIQVATQEQLLIDTHQLNRGIQNILSNSFHYLNQHFVISAKVQQHSFILQMENDGVTVGAECAEQIFERFYTGEESNANGHLGLGLAIARSLIESMAGSLNADIQADIIRFKLILPLISPDSA